MHIPPRREIALTQMSSQTEVITESDTSAHSYTLEDVVIHDQGHISPFAAPACQMHRVSSSSAGQQITSAYPSDSLPPPSQVAQPVTSRRTSSLRVSIDIPPSRNLNNLDNALVEGRVVRRRRRLPINIVIFFGLVSVTCLAVALTTLSIGIYNFTKLKASRAAKTVAALSDDISPLIHAIYDKLFKTKTQAPP